MLVVLVVKVMKELFVAFLLFSTIAFAESCPNGFVTYEYENLVPAISGTCPTGYVAHDVVDVCGDDTTSVCWLIEQIRALCNAGVSNIKTSNGVNVPLYSERGTTPSLCINYNNTTCYADLESGSVGGAINVKYNGATYHTVK